MQGESKEGFLWACPLPDIGPDPQTAALILIGGGGGGTLYTKQAPVLFWQVLSITLRQFPYSVSIQNKENGQGCGSEIQ